MDQKNSLIPSQALSSTNFVTNRNNGGTTSNVSSSTVISTVAASQQNTGRDVEHRPDRINETRPIGSSTVKSDQDLKKNDSNHAAAAASNDNNNMLGSNTDKKKRNRKKKKAPPPTSIQNSNGGTIEAIDGQIVPLMGSMNIQQDEQQQQKKSNKMQGKKKNNHNKKTTTTADQDTNTIQQKEVTSSSNHDDIPLSKMQKQRRGGNRPRSNNKNNTDPPTRNQYFWWKKYIPLDSVDPITLDPLRSLKYPPFALVATEPYVPIPEWPILKDEIKKIQQHEKKEVLPTITETAEERERRILQEQWGVDHVSELVKDSENCFDPSTENDVNANMKTKTSTDHAEVRIVPLHERHVNLFDGQALAYYMVSQLQFIDPLNRRDLIRDELVELDRYLRRHGFGDKLNVTEAYDTKGITLSTAGAAANTASGRALILQQEARNLLNALFCGTSVSNTPRMKETKPNKANTRNNNNNNNNDANALMQQYRAYENATQEQQRQRMGQSVGSTNYVARDNFETEIDHGVYGSAGLMVIDDDENPGLRSGRHVHRFLLPTPNDNNIQLSSWSSNQIATRHGSRARVVQPQEFPSLSDVLPTANASTETSSTTTTTTKGEQKEFRANKKELPKVKTLLKIGSAVKKTDPKETHRQWEAREMARKKAILSNLTFGNNQAAWMGGPSLTPAEQLLGIPSYINTIPSSTNVINSTIGPTEGQIERNKAFAEALGVKPLRTSLTSGWARPTDTRSMMMDEFGNELLTTVYPDSLILKAREYMTSLLKLENRWMTFLRDDKSASLPLNKMEKPLRVIVHEYASFWCIHTESFDPEPRRYIHCVKLIDTRAPYPLLSDAARSWKGPKPIIASHFETPFVTGGSTISSSNGVVVNGGGGGDEKRHLEHSFDQTAGQGTRGSREVPPPQFDRVPLSLKPRSSVIQDISGSMMSGGGVSLGGAPSRTMTEALMEPSDSRFGILTEGRERQKLDLKPRTLPLELPPQKVPINLFDDSYRSKERANARVVKERLKERMKQKLLQDAFASDDDDDDDERNKERPKGIRKLRTHHDDDDDDSEWEEQEELYASDNES